SGVRPGPSTAGSGRIWRPRSPAARPGHRRVRRAWTAHRTACAPECLERSLVSHLPLLDSVDPPRAQPYRTAQWGDLGHRVGDGVEHQVDFQFGQVGADAVVRAGAAETDVRIGVAQDVEGERVGEALFVEIGRAVEQAEPLTFGNALATEGEVFGGGALEGRHRGGPAHDRIRRGARPLLAVELPSFGM